MVKTWNHGIDNTNGIDLDSWYGIGTPESHMYERAECCPYTEFSPLMISNMNISSRDSNRQSSSSRTQARHDKSYFTIFLLFPGDNAGYAVPVLLDAICHPFNDGYPRLF